MTTPTDNGFRHWSIMLRLLAPGPVALGMRACIDPTYWRSFRIPREGDRR